MLRDYIIQQRLGVGSYGTVYKAKKKNTDEIYVIKQISLLGLVSQQINEYKLEASILSSIQSNYVVKYYDSFEEQNNLNIVMEYCDGGDLYQFLEEKKKKKIILKEDLIWELFIKMILGLSSIHKKKILHRDLKSQNIFLTKNLGVKIGDLGVAKKLIQTNFAKTFIGTPYYLSPELCSEKPYNDKSDIWAIGCILYELCTYKHPFNAKSQGALILKILNSNPEKINQKYSKDLQKMIGILLNKDYLQRPSCSDILRMPIVLFKAKNCNLLGVILKENTKTHLYIDLDNSTYIQNKERKSYEVEKVSKKYKNEEKIKDLEKNQINKSSEHYNNLLEGFSPSALKKKELGRGSCKNNKQINNNATNNSFIKYKSKYNNHFYYNSNNKKKNIKEEYNSKKEIVNLTKNTNNNSKIIKKVISKIINQKNNQKSSIYQETKSKKEERFIEMLNNALNEVNSKIKYISKKEKSFIKQNNNLHHEKSKTPSIKNIKKCEISFFQNAKPINNINLKNVINEYSDKQINNQNNQYQNYSKNNCNTEEKVLRQKSKEKIKIQENIILNKENNIKINNIKNYSNNIINIKNIGMIDKKENLVKKSSNSNININKQKKIFDIQDFANNLNSYVNRYKTSEFNTLSKDYGSHNINKINNKYKKYISNNYDYNKENGNFIKKDNSTIEEENSNINKSSIKNKVFEININNLDNNISNNNNNFINNNINININNINNNSSSNTINNNNNNIVIMIQIYILI